jgi:hypothetical protein
MEILPRQNDKSRNFNHKKKLSLGIFHYYLIDYQILTLFSGAMYIPSPLISKRLVERVSHFAKAHTHGTFLESVDLFTWFLIAASLALDLQMVAQDIKKRCSCITIIRPGLLLFKQL